MSAALNESGARQSLDLGDGASLNALIDSLKKAINIPDVSRHIDDLSSILCVEHGVIDFEMFKSLSVDAFGAYCSTRSWRSASVPASVPLW